MIIFDNETTGLLEPRALPISKQPFIIEFGAVRLNDKTLKQEAEITFLVNSPGRPVMTAEMTKNAGGITEAMLKDALPFSAHYPALCKFYKGEETCVAHNCNFDISLLEFDLTRIGKLLNFPWPINHICTVERSFYIKGRRMKLTELYEHATGRVLKQTHRALDDVKALAMIVRWLRERKKI